jgi:hypothetical protein
MFEDIDWNEELAPIAGELVRGEHAKAALALQRQQRIAQATATVEARCIDGLGQPIMQLDQELWMRLRHEFGQDCFADASFRRSLLQKNPELRVNTHRPTSVRGYRAKDSQVASVRAR